MSLSAATLKRRSRTGRNSSVGNVVPSSSAKSSSKAPRIPLKDLQGTQEQADSTGDAVVKLFDESEVNPFGTRSKLVSQRNFVNNVYLVFSRSLLRPIFDLFILTSKCKPIFIETRRRELQITKQLI